MHAWWRIKLEAIKGPSMLVYIYIERESEREKEKRAFIHILTHDIHVYSEKKSEKKVQMKNSFEILKLKF